MLRKFVIFISTPGMMDLARLPVKRRTAKSTINSSNLFKILSKKENEITFFFF